MKFVYSDETEKQNFETFLDEKFSARDTSLEYDWRYKKGILSSLQNFYNRDHALLPIGFLAYLKVALKKENFQIEFIEYRQIPKRILKALNDALLRDYQKEAITVATEYTTSIIKLPVGSGKTIVAGYIGKVYPKSTVLYIFPSIDLVHQTYNEFVEKCGYKSEEISIFQGNNVVDEGRIILLSADSYLKAAHRFPEVGVIVTDECHYTNNTIEKIVYSCQKASVKIGLSATPTHPNPFLLMKMHSFFGPISYQKEIVEMIEQKNLVNINVELHEVECSKMNVVGSWNDIYDTKKITDTNRQTLLDMGYDLNENEGVGRKFIEYGDESIAIVRNPVRNAMIAELALNHPRVLILFSKLAHGEILKELLGQNAILISGKDDLTIRNQAKDALEKHDDAIVIASNIFNTGVSINNIKTLINASGGKSPILTEQKLGRATRKSESIEKMQAKIIDFIDNYHPMTRKQTSQRLKVYNSLNLPIIYL
jgi:superfamily II DNA or RNA helicase